MKGRNRLPILLCMLIAAGCGKDEITQQTVRVNSITLSTKSATLYAGETLQLTASVLPADATDKRIAWTSENGKVATVDEDGLVTALTPGTSKISGKAIGGDVGATCLVTVLEPIDPTVHVASVSIEPASASLTIGETIALTATVRPENADNSAVNWSSSEPSVATVEDGTVTAVAKGSAVITVTSVDGGRTASCKITVKGERQEDPENDDPTGTKGVGEFPSVWIELSASSVERYSYKTTTITFKDPASWYTSVEDLEVEALIRGRGNMSWGLSKKPFRIKFTEEEGGHRVLGMNRNRDWDLIANANDKTLLRNSIGFHIAKELGFDWTPKVRAVELYMNGSYRGNYILVQHKETASEKVNIVPADPTTAPEDGDYYIEVEDSDYSTSFPTGYLSERYKMAFLWNDPETLPQNQHNYLKGIIDTIEKGLQEQDFTAVWGNLEMSTMVDYFILKELAKDIDGCLRKSNYFTKEKGRKMRMCHVWDFDLGFGNCSDLLYDGHEYSGAPTGWFIKEIGGNYSQGPYGKGQGWYPAMFKDPDFVAAVKARWIEVYDILAAVPDWADKQVGYYRTGYNHNFEKWSISRDDTSINYKISYSYDEAIANFKDWYNTRLAWMDAEIRKW